MDNKNLKVQKTLKKQLGTDALMKMFDVTKRAKSQWRQNGITVARLMCLELRQPDFLWDQEKIYIFKTTTQGKAMSGCNDKLNARKSGDGRLRRCLLHTLPELLRGIWVSQTATQLRVLLFKTTQNSKSNQRCQDYNKSACWVPIAPPLAGL